MVFEQYIANEYARALTVLIVFLFGTRVILFLTGKAALKLTTKTKTDLDDKLVQRTSTPLTYLSFFISLVFAINELTLAENMRLVVLNFNYSFIVIFLSYLVYVIIEVVVINAIKKLAIKTKTNTDDSLISLFHSVLRISLIVITFLYILNLWGVEITPLLAGLGIAGLAIALALQPVLSNIFSGASIIFDKTVRVGDLVYLDANTKGKIERVGLRSTRIRTFDNELIIVPNNKLAESTIQNVALPEPKSRVVLQFGVAYGSDIEKVKKVVLKEIRTIKLACKDPEPLVRFLEMANSSLNFKAYFFVESFEDRFKTIDEANTKIYNALNREGISIPFPQVDVHLKKE